MRLPRRKFQQNFQHKISITFIPNSITLVRIILAISLFFLKPLGPVFYIIYFTAGISDMLDGYLARKLKAESSLGARLDSLSDLIMIAAVIIILFPVIKIPDNLLYWAAAVALIRFVSIAIVLIKYRTFGILHTYGNKATGFMLFLFPLIIKSEVLMYLLCITASVSAIEELIIHLISKELDVDRKSLFYRNRERLKG